MLINFTVSNFLSFNEPVTLSLEARAKTKKFTERVYKNGRLKLTKCEAVFGGNASGKSNLIEAIDFLRQTLDKGFPKGFSNKYYRLSQENITKPSQFEIEFLLSDKRFRYGFTAILNSANILSEYLYEITSAGKTRKLYDRDTSEEIFEVGSYFKDNAAIAKLLIYGQDSSGDKESLFLAIINKSKAKMFNETPDLAVLKDIFEWIINGINIITPSSRFIGYALLQENELEEMGALLEALGTGVSRIQIKKTTLDSVKSKIRKEFLDDILFDLEKENAKSARDNTGFPPTLAIQLENCYYLFTLSSTGELEVSTLESFHEKENTAFELDEESDGTVRLIDLAGILFRFTDNSVCVVDEIDRCLHPAITTRFVELFLSMAAKRNTQLIFTTHELRLLSNKILRNDEINFMVKTRDGSTIIKSFEKMNNVRADKSWTKALFDGDIDVLPAFDEERLKSISDNNVHFEPAIGH